MELSVAEVAERLGVSPRRVRERIELGDLSARRIGRSWVVEETQLAGSARVSRPMSVRVSWAFLDLLAGGRAESVSQPERSRLRRKQEQLISAGADGPALMRSWLRRRAAPLWLSVASSDLEDLKADERVVPSGVSDPRSGVSAADLVEGYVDRRDLAAVQSDFLLSAKGSHNVLFHVVDGPVPSSPVPLPVLIADLADHDGPRENAAAAALIRQLR
jgi:excisionase family DNA binding protein